MAIDRGGRREYAILLFEMVKHCSTISTAALLLMAIFMEASSRTRKPSHPPFRPLGPLSFRLLRGSF